MSERVIRQEFNESYLGACRNKDVRHHRNGHCYLEFIEKARDGQTIVAKARVLYGLQHLIFKTIFEKETGQPFTSGITVLVSVTIDFHETYGYVCSSMMWIHHTPLERLLATG